ncbi:MAG: HDOD domain-containing protein [Spirochaetes bacterium]|nr:HDOD domain-containing protein [Spirochaetota bacterium]
MSNFTNRKERIYNRIKNTRQFNSIEDVLSKGLDTLEGAGFGIILTILTLRKIGLNENVFRIIAREKDTKVQIIIPLTLLDVKQEEFIAETAEKEIKEIPQFPQHVIELQNILSDPNANFFKLSHIINKDPSLIADLLKVANSCMYMLPTKVKTIEAAVRQIGFKGVRNLVLTYSSEKLMKDKYNIHLVEHTMNHSSEVAFYAYELARVFKFAEIMDEIYTAAILHDLGKIVINSLKPDVINKIEKICNEKGISANFIENLTKGFNHSIIGARLAQSWNFPDSIIEAIKYHHTPLKASKKNYKLVFIVYLANIIYYYKRKEYVFFNINYKILKFLNLTEQKDFDRIFNFLTSTFEKRKEIKARPY